MNIKLVFNNNDINIVVDRIGVFLGANNSGKTYLLETLATGFSGGIDSFEVDGLKVYKGDFKVIFLTDEMDLNSEFKLSKSNELRKLIYDEMLDETIGKTRNEEQILYDLNNKLEFINNQVDSLLEEKINKESSATLKITTKFDSIEKIIEKFTDIYIDDQLIKENKSSKSSIRELLFKLLILLGNKSQNDQIIFIIDNIESFLSIESILKFLDIIKVVLTEKSNIHFIISSSNSNIYKYVFQTCNIYKIKKLSLHKLNNINDIIKHAIILKEYGVVDDGVTLESFYEQNEHLVIEDDIITYREKYFYSNLEKIGILYVSDKCKIVDSIQDDFTNYIVTKSNTESILFGLISAELGVDTKQH